MVEMELIGCRRRGGLRKGCVGIINEGMETAGMTKEMQEIGRNGKRLPAVVVKNG